MLCNFMKLSLCRCVAVSLCRCVAVSSLVRRAIQVKLFLVKFSLLLLFLFSTNLIAASADSLTRRDYAVPFHDATLCDALTFGAGWPVPMKLYVKYATNEEYELVKDAAKKWNDLVNKDLIKLKPKGQGADDKKTFNGDSVMSFNRGRTNKSFGYADVLLLDEDGKGTCHNGGWLNDYKKSSPDCDDSRKSDKRPKWIREADFEIFPDNHTRFSSGSYLASSFFLNKTDLLNTIIHELGHGLGLRHNVISNSIMSYDHEQILQNEINDLFYLTKLFYNYNWEWLQVYMWNKIKPVEMDQLAISCLYPFELWGQ